MTWHQLQWSTGHYCDANGIRWSTVPLDGEASTNGRGRWQLLCQGRDAGVFPNERMAMATADWPSHARACGSKL